MAKILWVALCPIAWSQDLTTDQIEAFGPRYLQFFLDHGSALGLAFYDFLPPVRTCLEPSCNAKKGTVNEGDPYARELAEALTVPVTVFTREFGPIPGLSTSFYCRQCQTHYYPNYWVSKKSSTRTYYLQPLKFIHTAQHIFIEGRIFELFTAMMLNSW
ncbi:hypothetical protein CVT26_004858 [Gymnopilus dilepis]|uniref:CxC5 like cysteine cluster associated with KDZ domain-containing protein n=1 Tax=Gymnopilus dilepis TaxID=231916 RepID=A0A409YTS6_9AGAR|nr:hypothetical protein CVT26_004858 [Gymnopilus dilepis]